MIIGLCGKKQSGKSTLAAYLVKTHDFAELSWASPLKDLIGIKLLGLTKDQVYGSEVQKETIDPFWGKSPRQLLQIIGTDCFREKVDPDFWVKIGRRTIEDFSFNKGYNVVVSDCRFPNELDTIKSLQDGYVVQVTRSDRPSLDMHASETALDNYTGYDLTIDAKSGEIDKLKYQIDAFIGGK